MKEKRRYLKVLVGGLTGDETFARKAINEALFSYFGDKGVSEARTWLIEWKQPYVILRCAHTAVGEVVAALALKRFFQGNDIALRVEKVSGTLAVLRKSRD